MREHVDQNKILLSLEAIRGNQKITSDNPESTYNALKKYGRDLLEEANVTSVDKQKKPASVKEDDSVANEVGINPLERQLIKLLLKNEKYIPLTMEHGELIKTDPAMRIISVITENLEKDGSLDIEKVIDQLDEIDRLKLYDIIENTVIIENEEVLFQGLLKTARINNLEETETCDFFNVFF